jgi:hypothetical protein
MLHEIHQQSYILPDMSQLNPKYFWIGLTSLENTLMFIFKLEVNIFSILFNFRTNRISDITYFDIWCRNNIILQKIYKKRNKKSGSCCAHLKTQGDNSLSKLNEIKRSFFFNQTWTKRWWTDQFVFDSYLWLRFEYKKLVR